MQVLNKETELNERETTCDLGYLTSAPYVKAHHDTDSLKCRKTSWN